MTPSRGLRAAALVACLALATGCSSDEAPEASEPAAATDDPTWVSAPTPTQDPDEATGDEDAPGDEATDGTEEPAGDPTEKPRRAPHSVAVHFQNGLMTGDPEVCDLLSPAARQNLVDTKVAEGVIRKGASCEKYVRTIAKTYADWDITVEAKLVKETATSAVVRVDMVLNDDVVDTRMKLEPSGDDTWEIVDWGQH